MAKINSSSRWSKIKIVTKQAGDECITAIEIVPPVEGAERHSIPISRPRTVARKFASIARSQVKRKRQMAAREKKVRPCNSAERHWCTSDNRQMWAVTLIKSPLAVRDLLTFPQPTNNIQHLPHPYPHVPYLPAHWNLRAHQTPWVTKCQSISKLRNSNS